MTTETYKFLLKIGDWSNDGHGICKDFWIESNKPLSDVQKAYDKAKRTLKDICPEDFCCDYQDSSVPEEVIDEALIHGYIIDPGDFYVTEMAEYTLWFIKQGDLDLILTISKQPDTLQTDSYIGYGLFE